MNAIFIQLDWRSIGSTLVALVIAWVAWEFSPRLIALLGLNDLEFLARVGAVILALSAAEAIFARLPGAEPPAH